MSSTTKIPGNQEVPVRYDNVSITLHWLTAALVVTQFVLAEFWGFTPKPLKHLMIVAHMSFGILLISVIVFRIIWRVMPSHQIPAATDGLDEHVSKAVYYLLYGLLSAQMILGVLLRWTDNQSLSFFGLQISSPFGSFSPATGDFVDRLHDINAWLIIVMASGHASAALFHRFVLGDNVLLRMLPRRPSR